ncbi:unnamed protein product [Cladocopium goreaui]|uniref:PHD-type domain-containing protein n=1 Tax=Cladocopium goreaui TaxID=2562237 RepID=A0A9P1GMX9_9DINO|nr:unnamed protein product [Cladocopium goreaui]
MFPWAEPIPLETPKQTELPDGATRKRRSGRPGTATLPAARRRRTASSNWRPASGWAKRTAGAAPASRPTSATLLSQPSYSHTGKVPMNNDGFMVRLGTEAGFRGRWYCGRILDPSEVPGASDQCGPEGGPQCRSCAEFQKRYEPDLNDDGFPVKRSTSSKACFKFYCGRNGVVAGTGGQCGPMEGPQCPSCQRLQESFQAFYINDEGCQLRPGKTRGFCGTYYCGRVLGVQAIPGSDGRCGPIDGPQCSSCKRFQATQQVWVDEEPQPRQHGQPQAPRVKREREESVQRDKSSREKKSKDSKARKSKSSQMVKSEQEAEKEAQKYREEVRSVRSMTSRGGETSRGGTTSRGTLPGIRTVNAMTSPRSSPSPSMTASPASPSASPSRSPSVSVPRTSVPSVPSVPRTRGKQSVPSPPVPVVPPRKKPEANVPMNRTLCSECGKGNPSGLMMCGMMGPGCRIATHKRCCRPPLKEVPEGDWFCEVCRANPQRHALHCSVCGLCDNPGELLLCDMGGKDCHRATHLRCCSPPLKVVPAGDWYCAICAKGPGAANRPPRADKPAPASAVTSAPSKGAGKGKKGSGASFGDALKVAAATRSQAPSGQAPTPSTSQRTPRTLD